MTFVDTLEALYEAGIWFALIAIIWSISTYTWSAK